MKAGVLHECGKPLVVEDVDLDAPKEGEVMVKLTASGVCRSDYVYVAGDPFSEPSLPTVMGHEGAGVVTEVGQGVTTVQPGDHVVMSWIYQCGVCRYCAVGRPNLCDVGRSPVFGSGYLADGTSRMSKAGRPYYHFGGISTMAEYSVASEKMVVKIDQDLPLDKAALVGCAVMTGVGAVVNTAGVEAGASVAIFGAGGVGISAVQGATLSGAYPIIAVDTNPNKLEFAREFGATHGVNASEKDPVEEIARLTGGGVDYAFEAIGNPTTMAQAYDAVCKGGTLVIIGGAKQGDMFSVPALSFPGAEKTIKGSSYGSARVSVDIPKLLGLYRAGKLKLDEMVTRTYPLDDVNQAFDDLHAGKNVRGLLLM